MRIAKMNDALLIAIDTQLARFAIEKIANLKSTASEPLLPIAQLVEQFIRKLSHEHILTDIKSNQLQLYQLEREMLILENENCSSEDISAMEQYRAHILI